MPLDILSIIRLRQVWYQFGVIGQGHGMGMAISNRREGCSDLLSLKNKKMRLKIASPNFIHAQFVIEIETQIFVLGY